MLIVLNKASLSLFPMSTVSSIEIGSSFIVRQVESDFRSAGKANESDPYIVQLANTDLLMYDQSVLGAYGVFVYSKSKITLKKLSFQITSFRNKNTSLKQLITL